MLDLKKYLHVKLQNVPQDWARTPTVVKAAPKALALPLVADWSGYYGLLEDASVVFVPYDEPQAGRPELDARIRNMALFQGARRYPELSALVPTRGADDETCSSCGGSGHYPVPAGIEPGSIICFCGGLGWIPRDAST